LSPEKTPLDRMTFAVVGGMSKIDEQLKAYEVQ